MQEVFIAEQVAGLLHCTTVQEEELLRIGELPGLKIGRAWIVPSEALSDRLNEMALEQALDRRSKRQLSGMQRLPTGRKSGKPRELGF